MEENKNTMDELKPCPFCGGQAEFVTNTIGYQNCDGIIGFSIRCKKCKTEYPKQYEITISLGSKGQIETGIDQRKQAVSDWNKRQGA